MGLLENVEGRINEWLVGVALKKAALKVAMAAGSYALAHAGVVSQWGVTASIDPNVLAGALMGGVEMLRNYLKTKYPTKMGWL